MPVRGSRAAVICAIASALAIAYVDRPIALALERAYRHSLAWVVVDRAFLAVEALFLFVAIAGAVMTFTVRGRRSASWWAGDLRACAAAGVVALIAAALLKVVFGRSGPDLTFVRDGIYEFRWFTGTWTPYHGAFPSATAAAASAMTFVLWLRRSPVRVSGALIASVLAAAVVVQQYHWLSDAIGGVGLGILVGAVLHARFATPGLAGEVATPYTPL